MSISTNKIGSQNIEAFLTALPIIPYLKLDGFAPEGMAWEDVEIATSILGADGKVAINNKPVVYKGTLNLLATSNSRTAIENLILLSTPFYGKRAVEYELILTINNYTTNSKSVYAGGQFSNTQSGDPFTLDDGQQTKSFQWFFSSKVVLPLI